jgi:4-hydroxy-3-methylbut-2-enyl diphosphate reductase
MPLRRIKRINKACVVAQSTQNLEKVLNLVGILKLYIEDLEFFNTICLPTRMKQEEIKKMPLENDVMIIIGSKTSANTKRLYEISKSINKRSFWIRSSKEIRREWFRGAKNVGITAGASTPDSTTQDVIKHIKSLEAVS